MISVFPVLTGISTYVIVSFLLNASMKEIIMMGLFLNVVSVGFMAYIFFHTLPHVLQVSYSNPTGAVVCSNISTEDDSEISSQERTVERTVEKTEDSLKITRHFTSSIEQELRELVETPESQPFIPEETTEFADLLHSKMH